MVTLFPCHPQTMQSLLSIEGGAEVSHCTPIMPQFHSTRETQCPYRGIHAGILRRVLQIMAFGASVKKGPKGWLEKGNVLALPSSTVNSNDHNWLCSGPWSRNRSPYRREDLWGVGEEQPLSFYGHCLGVAHAHMWQPTISHPSVHCNQARSDLQHGVGTMV